VKPLKILYVCSEMAPLVVTGGLADVAGALPRALRAQGHDVRVAMPCYDVIPPELRGEAQCPCVADLGAKTAHGTLREAVVPDTEVPLYLVEHEGYFGRDRLYGTGAYEFADNAERYCFFCLALLHGVGQGSWRPDIVHCNDWHTAAIPALIKTRLAHTAAWRGMPTLFTIHNLAYQGRYKAHLLPYTGLGADLFTPDCLEFHGDINLMKAGIAFASQINTVSPRYAKEIQTPEFGEGLEGFLRTRADSLSGILNGVDYALWNPRTDPHIARNYSADDLGGKAVCKREIQGRLGLARRDVPLVVMVSRIRWQKGIDVLIEALDRVLAHDVQLAILGTGDPELEQALEKAGRRFPDRLRVMMKFDRALSHQLEAGADFFLMPSRFEPCGLSQLYSMAYGTVPIVRKTGGLADSVTPISKANLAKGRATGIVLRDMSVDGIARSIEQAVGLYSDAATFRRVQVTGMREDFSWDRSSRAYVRLYRKAAARP